MSVSCLYRVGRGEQVMRGAPTISVDGVQLHIPQHYLTYSHDIESIRAILCDISIAEDILLFANKDSQGMYLQVGIIGRENYQVSGLTYPPKIVYGRRWRIDSDTPTSEIVQTVMLAVQKVLEHEVRELLTIQLDNGTKSAPLTSHQDVHYLMKSNVAYQDKIVSQRPQSQDSVHMTPIQFEDSVKHKLASLRFANHHISIRQFTTISNDRAVVDLNLEVQPPPSDFEASSDSLKAASLLPEAFSAMSFSVLVSIYHIDKLMFDLLDVLIAISDRYVEENFSFNNFRRFSRDYLPEWLAQRSIESRPYSAHMKDVQFKQTFEALNFETDEQRTPVLGFDTLAKINTSKMSRHPDLCGHLPKGSATLLMKQA